MLETVGKKRTKRKGVSLMVKLTDEQKETIDTVIDYLEMYKSAPEQVLLEIAVYKIAEHLSAVNNQSNHGTH